MKTPRHVWPAGGEVAHFALGWNGEGEEVSHIPLTGVCRTRKSNVPNVNQAWAWHRRIRLQDAKSNAPDGVLLSRVLCFRCARRSVRFYPSVASSEKRSAERKGVSFWPELQEPSNAHSNRNGYVYDDWGYVQNEVSLFNWITLFKIKLPLSRCLRAWLTRVRLQSHHSHTLPTLSKRNLSPCVPFQFPKTFISTKKLPSWITKFPIALREDFVFVPVGCVKAKVFTWNVKN